MENLHFLVPLFGLAGLAIAFITYRRIVIEPGGDGRVAEIAGQIHTGAMVFMRRELFLIGAFAIVVGGLLSLKDPWESLAFFLGAAASSLAGYIGMYSATHVNVRTALAAHNKGSGAALTTAFFGGSIMGLTVASRGLLGGGSLFLFFGESEKDVHIIHGFAMGASLVAIFYRIGGGIFTKAADVGADLVGKVESGIPEDDPRNPGVIADNVGDNVGDVAGMGADLFESYCNAMIASMAIAATLTIAQWEDLAAARGNLMFLPLALASTGLLCSLAGIGLVKLSANNQPARALRTGTIGAATLFVLLAGGVISMLGVDLKVWFCVLMGSIGGIAIGLSTEYYTGGAPMKSISKAALTGVATVMIRGLAVGMFSVVIPLAVVAFVILGASHFAGLYGVGIAAVGMLATIGITMSIDAYGPIADNAGGIAEMAGMGKQTRSITDKLD
ncbi:MAG: sodium/proton-translocating pyrophosphatase, partial [Chthoniobacterales bacterium]